MSVSSRTKREFAACRLSLGQLSVRRLAVRQHLLADAGRDGNAL
ncbi:hypothetical protein [Stieleria bergensis]